MSFPGSANVHAAAEAGAAAGVFVDLHTHTRHSDGLLAPAELLRLADNKGLRAIAITDHDCADGIPEAVAAGQEIGVEVIPGVELSCSGAKSEIHILGYFIDPNSEALAAALTQFRAWRRQRARAMVERLNGQGVPLEFERVTAVAGDTAIGRPHIAQALFELGVVDSFQGAFTKYLKRGGPAFVAKQMITPEAAIELIHDAGGLAVVAHPTYGPTPGELRSLIGHGLDGIEVWHPLLDAEDTSAFTEIAREYRILTTGGSDFHGAGRSHCELGGMHVAYEYLERMHEHSNGSLSPPLRER